MPSDNIIVPEFDYDIMLNKFHDFIKEDTATFGRPWEALDKTFGITKFDVDDKPLEFKKFAADDKLASAASGGLSGLPQGLIDKLKEDDYYLIHFPLNIETNFPFDKIELKLELATQETGHYFVSVFPNEKTKDLLNGSFEGNVGFEFAEEIDFKALKQLTPAAPDLKASASAKFNLSSGFKFRIKRSIIERNGGDKTFFVKWIFRRDNAVGGLDETISNITAIIKKPKKLPFSDINVTYSGIRKYNFWPQWLVDLMKPSWKNLDKNPGLKEFVRGGFPIGKSEKDPIQWKTSQLEKAL